METDYWAHHYFDNPVKDEVEDADFDLEQELAKLEQNEGDMMELNTRLQIAQFNMQTRQQELQMQREIEMLKMANQQNLTLEQIKAKLADTAMRERGRKELFAAEQRLKLVAGSGI